MLVHSCPWLAVRSDPALRPTTGLSFSGRRCSGCFLAIAWANHRLMQCLRVMLATTFLHALLCPLASPGWSHTPPFTPLTHTLAILPAVNYNALWPGEPAPPTTALQ